MHRQPLAAANAWFILKPKLGNRRDSSALTAQRKVMGGAR